MTGTERTYSVDEIGKLWATSAGKIRRLFEGQPGVIVVPHPAVPNKKKFARLMISESSVVRVYEQLTRSVR